MMWEVVGPRERAPPQLSRLVSTAWAKVGERVRRKGRRGLMSILGNGGKVKYSESNEQEVNGRK
jgi:hypothetical protein